MRRRRGLSSEDAELWSRIAATASPLHPPARQPKPPEATPSPRIPDPGPAPNAGPRASLPAFRAGEGATAPRRPLSSTAAPSPAQELALAGLRMDSKTHRRMTQGKLRPDARLDLHGMFLAEAHPRLIEFVLSCHISGLRLVLIITGKGRGSHGPLPTRPGALRHQVPHWLHQAPLSGIVQQVTVAHDRHGGEGAYYVYLRRRLG